MSPIKVHGTSYYGRKRLGKRKIATVIGASKEKVGKTLNITQEDLEDSEVAVPDDIKQKALQFDRLMGLVKDKVLSTDNNHEKIRYLTSCPGEWSIKKASSYFEVSHYRYMIRKARSVCKDNGIFSLLIKKKGKSIEDVKEKVFMFFEDDENSR